jgi:hypothetical protein
MEAQSVTQHSSQRKEYPIRYVGVVFGNPRSEECAGYGICRMEDEGPFPPIKPQKRAALACYQHHQALVKKLGMVDGKNVLRFSFEKKGLSEAIVTKYFGAKQFVIATNALHLPASLTTAFDMDPSVLVEGLYPISETTTHFHIPIQTT